MASRDAKASALPRRERHLKFRLVAHRKTARALTGQTFQADVAITDDLAGATHMAIVVQPADTRSLDDESFGREIVERQRKGLHRSLADHMPGWNAMPAVAIRSPRAGA